MVDGVGSSKANTQMDIDFAAKGLQETVIQPFSTANGVIFVPTSELQPNLIINIVDRETREKLSFTFSDIKYISRITFGETRLGSNLHYSITLKILETPYLILGIFTFSFAVPSGQASADIACSRDYHTSDPSHRVILAVFQH